LTVCIINVVQRKHKLIIKIKGYLTWKNVMDFSKSSTDVVSSSCKTKQFSEYAFWHSHNMYCGIVVITWGSTFIILGGWAKLLI